jgi:prepilin-type N-terminal cleavage/methylation domain-containing protein
MATQQTAHAGTAASGFTLVELLVSLVISLCVIGSATVLAGQMQMSYRRQLEASTAQQEGRYAVEWIERYIRAAGNNPYRVTTSACPAAGTAFQAIRINPLGAASNNNIRLQMDGSPVDGLIGGAAAACTEPDEDVTIALDTQNRVITLRDNNVGAVAVPRSDTIVSNLQFTFRDPNRNVTTNPNNIAFVQTTVTVQSRLNDLNTGQPISFPVSSEVRVRVR